MRPALPASLHARLELSLYLVEAAPYTSLRLLDNVMPHWIISFVQEGRVETATRGERNWAEAGDVMVHPPHLPFSECADGPGTHLYFVCDVQVSPNLDLLRLHPVPPVVRVLRPDAYAETFDHLANAWATPASPVRDLRVFTLATDLLTCILESWSAAGSLPRPPALQTPEDRFVDVVTFMAEHLDRKLTRDDLAGHVCLHPGYFDRVFRAAYGTAPMQMLRDLRLRRAQQLLETTEDTLDSIASACGLGDAAAFSRAFKARYDSAPGQYRERAKVTRQSMIYPTPPDASEITA